MRWCMIELTIKCPCCDASVHVDAPRQSLLCGKCMSEIDFPVEVWRDTLSGALSGLKHLKTGEGNQSTIFGHFNMSLLYGKLVPYGPDCKRDVDPEGDREGGHLKCRDCGSVMAIREAPPWFREAVPRARLVAGGAPEGKAQGSHGIDNPSGGAVALSCPKCAASLLIDGRERLVPCGYCNTRVYLPDDLWLRLHPANMKTRWFIGF